MRAHQRRTRDQGNPCFLLIFPGRRKMTKSETIESQGRRLTGVQSAQRGAVARRELFSVNDRGELVDEFRQTRRLLFWGVIRCWSIHEATPSVVETDYTDSQSIGRATRPGNGSSDRPCPVDGQLFH